MPSTTPTRPGSRSRTVEPAVSSERGLSIPESWLRGILAGAEGVFGTWLVVIVPVVAVYIATAAAPDLGSASWLEAARLGTGVWAVAHGAALDLDGATISLMPLGLTLLAFFLLAIAIRRAALATWAGVGFAVGTYMAGAALLVQFVAVPGAGRAVWGAVVLACLSAAWALRKERPRPPKRLLSAGTVVQKRWHAWVNAGGRANIIASATTVLRAAWAATGRALAMIGVLATVAAILAVIFGLPVVLAVQRELEPDTVSTLVLAGAQLLLVPTLIVWAAAYLSGAGFALGEGTLYSPSEVVSAPLPAVPILGALPSPESALLPFLGFTFVIIGLLAGLFLRRRFAALTDGEPHLAAVLTGALLAGALIVGGMALAAELASGGFGPGRFIDGVGPLRGRLAVATAWQITVPMLAVVLVAHPATGRAARAGWAKARVLLARGATAE